MTEDKNEATRFEWARFIVGSVLFVFLILIHAYVRELSVFILAIPGAVMGLDLGKVITLPVKK